AGGKPDKRRHTFALRLCFRIAFCTGCNLCRARWSMLRIVFAVNCLFALLYPVAASAWGYQGHKVVGSIADKMLKPNAKEKVKQILGPGLDLRRVAPWADCVRSVVRRDNGTFEYVVDPDHLEYEVPCTPFKSDAERAAMVDYVSRNW